MTMVGHETVRSLVMGKDYKRKATPEEIAKMAELVEQGMREGALGLSSGLEYEVGSYASTEELVELCKAAARHGGFYMTHIRDEADKSFEAFAEAIAIAERAECRSRSPTSSSRRSASGERRRRRSRSSSEPAPRAPTSRRTATRTRPGTPTWKSSSPTSSIRPDERREGARDVGGPWRITVTACKAHPGYARRNLEEIARAEKITPVELFSKIIRDGGADVIGHSMTEEDVQTFYRQPWVMVGSDGGIATDHPRGAGTFPRVLGRFVREKRLFPLEEAIRKMTSLPARRVGLSDRGRIAPGMKADLVLFDPEKVIDRSTFEEPRKLSEGSSGSASTARRSGRVARPRALAPDACSRAPDGSGALESPLP